LNFETYLLQTLICICVHECRIQITISLPGSNNKELQAQNIFPLYVLFARPTSNVPIEGHSPIYRFSQARLLTSFNDSGNNDRAEATFVIPDLETLIATQAYGLTFILVSRGTKKNKGRTGQNLCENDCSEKHVDYSSLRSKSVIELNNWYSVITFCFLMPWMM
jgi:hypothetical protein